MSHPESEPTRLAHDHLPRAPPAHPRPSSSASIASSSSSTTSPHRSASKKPQLVLTTPPAALLNQSNAALLASVGPHASAYAPDGTKKLSKWLSRNRAKSVGTATALGSSTNSNGLATANTPSAANGPSISVSPSSSAGSNLSQQQQPLYDSTTQSPVRPQSARTRSSTSATSPALGGGERSSSGGFANLSLRTSRRSRGAGDEVLEEWATPDVEDGVEDPNGRSQTAVAAPRATGNGGGLFSLKRTKSHLRLFGTAKAEQQAEASSTSADDPADLRSSTSSFQLAQAGPSALPNSHSFTYGQAQNGTNNPNANVAGRIGGWFTSMLHSTSSSHLPLPADGTLSPSPPTSRPPSAPNSTPNTVRSPNKRGSNGPGSGGGGGGARLGPLDRMLDKAVQYFLDTDSQADKCEDDIWVLGVRHRGYVAPSVVPVVGDDVEVLSIASGSGESSGRADEQRQRKRKSVQSVLVRKGRKGKDRQQQQRGSVDLVEPSHSNSSSPPASTSPPDDQFETRSVSSSPPSSLSLSPQPSFQGSGTVPPPPSLQTHGWPAEFYLDFYSRLALTYRTGFPPIPCAPAQSGGVHGVFNSLSMSIGRGGPRTSEGLSSDTGWGCMLRTGQSLLANTLLTIHLGRDWRRPLPPPPTPSPQQQTTPTSAHTPLPSPPPLAPSHAEYARILSLFLDDPSPLAPFSVHRFALMGKKLGKDVGEWFGPSTAAGAIKALVTDFEPAGLAVCSVVDGSVYKTDVEAAATNADGERWAKPVLVLIGLRLGIDGVHPIYHEAVKAIFSFPQSVGIAGGRPSSSYYFVGAQANSLFYIDPHHPRAALALQSPSADLVPLAQSLPLATPLSSSSSHGHAISDSFITVTPSPPITPVQGPVSTATDHERLADFFEDAYSDQNLRTYHTDKVRKMAITSLDPSMLVGFLIRDEDDWDDFSSRVRLLSQAHKPIFSIADSPPAWMKRSTGTTGAHSTSTDESASATGSFSEPDDWEISSEADPLEHADAVHSHSEDEDEWEPSATAARDQSPSPLPKPRSVTTMTMEDDSAWQTVGPASPSPAPAPAPAPASHSTAPNVLASSTSSSSHPAGDASPLSASLVHVVVVPAPPLSEGWEGLPSAGEKAVETDASASESDDLAESFSLAPSTAESSLSLERP
ncbi:hypothetical protein RQP46_006853 [Phenoliferia psychrophenolica]